MRNPYAILGLSSDADPAAIKAAYRRLAKTLHPDAQRADGTSTTKSASDAQARFQDVTAAYNLLKDKAARARFDATAAAEAERKAWSRATMRDDFEAAPFTRPSHRASFEPEMMGQGADADGASTNADMFSGLFGGLRDAGKRVFRARGDDQAYRLQVSFLDAARGGKQRITLNDGRALDIKVPSGVEDGRQIRLRGQGGDGYGGAPAGDALITIAVEPHPSLTREGRHIFLDLPISLSEAVIGTKIKVETISGPVSLNIPAGSNTGTRLRLKGRGIAAEGNNKAGDQYVTLRIVLPDTYDQALRDFVAGWGPGLVHDPRRKPQD